MHLERGASDLNRDAMRYYRESSREHRDRMRKDRQASHPGRGFADLRNTAADFSEMKLRVAPRRGELWLAKGLLSENLVQAKFNHQTQKRMNHG
jgi:hypothetical protein